MEIIHSSNYTHSARTRTFSQQHNTSQAASQAGWQVPAEPNSIPALLALWDLPLTSDRSAPTTGKGEREGPEG